MADTRLVWGAEGLWEALNPLLHDLSVEIVASLPSTNTTLLERARAATVAASSADTEGALVRRSIESGAFGRRAVDWQPCLLVAEEQTAGRGRMGREWHAEPLASLSFSLALPLAPVDWSGLSLAVGVALADALDPASGATGGHRIGLKWPNDLWLLDPAPNGTVPAGRKLGGILIETVSTGQKRLAVIGIGLNVLPQAALRSAEASSGVAWLQELQPSVTAPQVLAAVALPLVRALQRFERDGFAAFAERFAARDLLKDRPVTTTQSGADEGIARGVSADGSLCVDTDRGRVLLHSGEVSVRPTGGKLADGRARAEPAC